MSVFVFLNWRRKLNRCWLRKTLLYEYSMMTSAIILDHFIAMFLDQTSSIYCFPRSLICLLLDSWPSSSVKDGFYLKEWYLNHFRYWIINSTSVMQLMNQHSLHTSHHCKYTVCSWAWVYIFPLGSCRIFFRTMGIGP